MLPFYVVFQLSLSQAIFSQCISAYFLLYGQATFADYVSTICTEIIIQPSPVATQLTVCTDWSCNLCHLFFSFLAVCGHEIFAYCFFFQLTFFTEIIVHLLPVVFQLIV